MTAPITPGWYAVEVTAEPASLVSGAYHLHACVHVASKAFHSWRIPADCLHPLPAATISAEAQAVLDAAVKWRGLTKHDPAYHVAVLSEAIDAYRATLTPPDPVAELVKLAQLQRDHLRNGKERFPSLYEWMDALAAVEAARGVR